MKKRLFLRAGSALATGAALAACGGGGGGGGVPIGGDTLLGVLQSDGRFSQLVRAVGAAGLGDLLIDGSTTMTMFAPDNDAFDRLGARLGFGDGNGVLGALRGDQWLNIIRYNLLQGFNSPASLSGQRPITLLDTYPTSTDDAVLIFNADGTIWDGIGRLLLRIVDSGIGASNGVVHVPNDIFLPRGVLTVGQMLRASVDFYARFADAMVNTGVASQLDGSGPFTVFAPFDEAAGPLGSAAQVGYHVVAGRNLVSGAFPAQVTLQTLGGRSTTLRKATGTRNGRTVLATLSDTSGSAAAAVVDVDFYGSNGVIHTIDKVLTL